jgi:CRP-like cAMP-binding protein
VYRFTCPHRDEPHSDTPKKRFAGESKKLPGSVPHMARSSASAAEDELRRWADAVARRDEVVLDAVAAGVSIHQIQQITGIARATIMRILARQPKRPLLTVVPRD